MCAICHFDLQSELWCEIATGIQWTEHRMIFYSFDCVFCLCMSLYLTFELKWPQRPKVRERGRERATFQQYVVRHNRKNRKFQFSFDFHFGINLMQ